MLEWECPVKDSVQGAHEGADFIKSLLIDTPKREFDDFAGGAEDTAALRKALNLE